MFLFNRRGSKESLGERVSGAEKMAELTRLSRTKKLKRILHRLYQHVCDTAEKGEYAVVVFMRGLEIREILHQVFQQFGYVVNECRGFLKIGWQVLEKIQQKSPYTIYERKVS